MELIEFRIGLQCKVYMLIVCFSPFFALSLFFRSSLQSHWLGNKYFIRGPEGNDIHKTNVPNIRIEFRHEVSFSFFRALALNCIFFCCHLIESFLADMEGRDAVCLLGKGHYSCRNRHLMELKWENKAFLSLAGTYSY